jgi:hypothetical protein
MEPSNELAIRAEIASETRRFVREDPANRLDLALWSTFRSSPTRLERNRTGQEKPIPLLSPVA